MKMRTLLVTLAAVAALIFGSMAPAGAATDNQDLSWWDGEPADNGAHTTLNRNNVTASAHVRGLPAGHAVTIWGVVFENPEYCIVANACTGADVDAAFGEVGDPAIDLTVAYAGGGVVNADGNLNTKSGIFGDVPGETVLIGDGTVDNPDTAEIHFVVRSHGPHQPGSGDTSTYLGGCTAELDPGTVPSAEGECSDLQFTVHRV